MGNGEGVVPCKVGLGPHCSLRDVVVAAVVAVGVVVVVVVVVDVVVVVVVAVVLTSFKILKN